eukprot:10253040-Lingulodinium_polyedra.AAC.1
MGSDGRFFDGRTGGSRARGPGRTRRRGCVVAKGGDPGRGGGSSYCPAVLVGVIASGRGVG